MKAKDLAPLPLDWADLENRFGVLTLKPAVWAARVGMALADRDVVLTSRVTNDPAQAILVKKGEGSQNALIWAQTQAKYGRGILVELDESPFMLLSLSADKVPQWAPATFDKEKQVWIGGRAVLWTPQASAPANVGTVPKGSAS